MNKLVLFVFCVVFGITGCCTYKGKLISCRDARNMKALGMDVSMPCDDDNCGKEPK